MFTEGSETVVMAARQVEGARVLERQGLDAFEAHAVVGDRARRDLDPAMQARDLNARPFAAREITGLGGRLGTRRRMA